MRFVNRVAKTFAGVTKPTFRLKPRAIKEYQINLPEKLLANR
jgi:hypothetical protein